MPRGQLNASHTDPAWRGFPEQCRLPRSLQLGPPGESQWLRGPAPALTPGDLGQVTLTAPCLSFLICKMGTQYSLHRLAVRIQSQCSWNSAGRVATAGPVSLSLSQTSQTKEMASSTLSDLEAKQKEDAMARPAPPPLAPEAASGQNACPVWTGPAVTLRCGGPD